MKNKYEWMWKGLYSKVLSDKIEYHTKQSEKDEYKLSELIEMMKVLERNYSNEE